MPSGSSNDHQDADQHQCDDRKKTDQKYPPQRSLSPLSSHDWLPRKLRRLGDGGVLTGEQSASRGWIFWGGISLRQLDRQFGQGFAGVPPLRPTVPPQQRRRSDSPFVDPLPQNGPCGRPVLAAAGRSNVPGRIGVVVQQTDRRHRPAIQRVQVIRDSSPTATCAAAVSAGSSNRPVPLLAC